MLVWVQVPSPAVSRSGGIGRRARFRSVWWQHHEGSSPFFCMTDSPVQRRAGFLLYSDSINSGINLRKTGLQFKWNCAILLFVGEKIIGQRKLKKSKRECWNWQTGKTKDLVGVCSCGFKSHLPHTEKRAESFDFIQVFCFFYCLNDTIFVSRCLTFLGGVATISCGGCRADKTSWSFCSVLVRVKM